MNQNAELLARRWRATQKGLARYADFETRRFDGERFDGLVKLVVSMRRRSLERQLANCRWPDSQRAA